MTINDGYWVPGVASNMTLSDWYCEWDWLSIRHDGGAREFAQKQPVRTPISGLNNRGKKGVVVFADGHADVVPRLRPLAGARDSPATALTSRSPGRTSW